MCVTELGFPVCEACSGRPLSVAALSANTNTRKCVVLWVIVSVKHSWAKTERKKVKNYYVILFFLDLHSFEILRSVE